MTGQWVVWLAAVAAFMTVSGLFIWVHVQRRLIARTQFVDSTATPMPMRPGDAELSRQLTDLGFVALGEVDFIRSFARPHHLWAFVNSDHTVRATVSRNWNRVSFLSYWADGFSLDTACRRLPDVSLPHYRQQGIPGVAKANDAHLETVDSLAYEHGQPLPVRSIDDLVAAERSDLAVVLPELDAKDRLNRLMILVIIAVFAVPLIILRPF